MSVKVTDVVQIDPSHDEKFGGCFMLVEEVKSWGVQGFVQIPGDGGRAYYRVPFGAFALIGESAWAPADVEDAE